MERRTNERVRTQSRRYRSIDLDPAVGRERAGTRPALVVSVDKFNHGPAGSGRGPAVGTSAGEARTYRGLTTGKYTSISSRAHQARRMYSKGHKLPDRSARAPARTSERLLFGAERVISESSPSQIGFRSPR
jgi:hypothetical protein